MTADNTLDPIDIQINGGLAVIQPKTSAIAAAAISNAEPPISAVIADRSRLFGRDLYVPALPEKAALAAVSARSPKDVAFVSEGCELVKI